MHVTPMCTSYIQVTKLELQFNHLEAIPACLLELPHLRDLNLSHNELTDLPLLPHWSSSLTTLDLSHNKLSTLPGHPDACSIEVLSLSHNKLDVVPRCIFSFVTLCMLDLSYNRIAVLPEEMGILRNLTTLNLNGLSCVRTVMTEGEALTKPGEEGTELRDILLHTSGNYHLKIVVLGEKGVGKSALVTLLSGADCKEDPETVGIRINKWTPCTCIKGQPLVFNIWDFSHLDSHCDIWQCFLTTHSVYLVLFDARHSWDTVDDSLVPWLEVLAERMEQSCVLIVGTHLDLLPTEQQEEMDLILKEVTRLADQYRGRLQIGTVLLVSLKDSHENIELLKEAICSCASTYSVHGIPVLGKKVPSCYHKIRDMAEDLYSTINRVKVCDPVMDEREYRRLIEGIGFTGVAIEGELDGVTEFLTHTGPLMHFRGSHANSVCFDPGWLYCALCALFNDPAVSEGGLRKSQVSLSIPHAQKHLDVLLSFMEQHCIVTTLSADLILVMSLLPSHCPENVCVDSVCGRWPYTRYILFEASPSTTFWACLLSSVVTAFPRVQSVADAQWAPCPPPVVGSRGPACEHTPQVYFWRTGVHYQDLEVAFRVESLSCSGQLTHERKEGVLIVVSSTDLGKKLIGRLVDTIVTLITDLHFSEPRCGSAPRSQRGYASKAETIPCSTCIRMRRPLPFEFHLEHCLSSAIQQKEVVECDCTTSTYGRNHKIALLDLAPDVVLADIEDQYHLDFSLLRIQEGSMIAMGTFGAIYSGTYMQSPVMIRRYTHSDSTYAFRCVRREALLLQTLDHPCVVRLVGVCPQELVLEHAPYGPLDLILSQHKLHRLTLHRLASEVGAALAYLHKQKLVLFSLRVSSILVWSLNPEHLCHCKLSCLDAARCFGSSVGCEADKMFAPETLQCNGLSRCDSKTDMFSFGMLLYHMVTGREPFHNVVREKVLLAIRRGLRPILETSCPHPFPYLIKLFQQCWEQYPSRRPTAEEAVQRLCLSSTQSVTNITHMKSHSLLLQSCCVVTQSDFATYNLPSRDTEVWFCFDGEEGTCIKTYSVHGMIVTKMNFVVENQVQAMSVCGDQVWVSSSAGVDCGRLDLFHIGSRERTHTVPTEAIVSCITCSNSFVYCGTLEGKCLIFSRDPCSLGTPQERVLSEHAVESMVCNGNCLWVSTAFSILFLDPCTFVTTSGAQVSKQGFVGRLRLSPDGGKVWSHRLGATYLSAWDVGQKGHLFDLGVQEHLKRISSCAEHDMSITAITFAADTVWVGVATGHILVFHNQEMLLWFHPYSSHVKFLLTFDDFMDSSDSKEAMGKGGKEKVPYVISAASGFQWSNPHDKEDSGGALPDMETLITWAAFPSNLCRQMNLLDRRSATFCEDHHFVAEMLQKEMFVQATCGATASTDEPTHSRPPPSDPADSSEGLDRSVSLILSYSYPASDALHS